MHRPSASARGYDADWRRLRLIVIAEQPICAEPECEKLTAEVDHVDGDAWNRGRENLRGLCKTHHSSRTARDQGFARKRK